MSRTIRRSNTLPSWEADRMSKAARKQIKQSRTASSKKRDAQDSLHRVDENDTEVLYYETC